MSPRRFDKITRFKITSLIHKCHESGQRTEEIAAELEKAGFKMTDGAPIALNYITGAIRKMAQEGLVNWQHESHQAHEVIKTKYLPDTAISILTDPNFTDKQKVKILLGMVDV